MPRRTAADVRASLDPEPPPRHQIPTPEELDQRARPGSLVDLERQRIEISTSIDRLLLSFGGDTAAAEALSEAQLALDSFGDLLRVAIRQAGSS